MEDKLIQQVEEKINMILDEGEIDNNIKMLGELVDIHKDIKNEEYWKEKLNMRGRYMGYGNDYGNNYGNNYMPEYERMTRDPRGKYSARGRGYRGEEMLDEVARNYETYMGGGNYNGPETDKAFDYMLKAAEDFMMHLFEESDSPEQVEKIKRTARKISEMRV